MVSISKDTYSLPQHKNRNQGGSNHGGSCCRAVCRFLIVFAKVVAALVICLHHKLPNTYQTLVASSVISLESPKKEAPPNPEHFEKDVSTSTGLGALRSTAVDNSTPSSLNFSSGESKDDKEHVNGLDFFWMTALKNTGLHLSFQQPRKFIFPLTTRRVWIDVGVNTKSDFLIDLDEQGGQDLFVIGYEPSGVWKPCPHDRCVVLWAAATPTFDVIEVNVQDGGDLCNSLLKPNTNTSTPLWKGCVTQKTTEDGRPLTVEAPGLPLHALIERIPETIIIEYIKIDAQGFDLEVMRGGFLASNRIQVVSLEAMDVQERSKLLYEGQPTLNEIKVAMGEAGWKFVKSVGNDGASGEVNAFFIYDIQHTHKVDQLAAILMGNKEGRGEGKNTEQKTSPTPPAIKEEDKPNQKTTLPPPSSRRRLHQERQRKKRVIKMDDQTTSKA